MVVDPSGLLSLFRKHLDWYPHMQVQDAYKLLYQGVMGPEHLFSNLQDFSLLLVAEFESLSSDAEQQLVEPIRVDQTLFRLNLRAYKSTHSSVDSLLPHLLDTLHTNHGIKADLIENWHAYVRICVQDLLDTFPISEVQSFSGWLEQADYPAIHHSEVYRREYQPAYRLISSQFIPLLGVPDAD
jgi:hypothetical protein